MPGDEPLICSLFPGFELDCAPYQAKAALTKSPREAYVQVAVLIQMPSQRIPVDTIDTEVDHQSLVQSTNTLSEEPRGGADVMLGVWETSISAFLQ